MKLKVKKLRSTLCHRAWTLHSEPSRATTSSLHIRVALSTLSAFIIVYTQAPYSNETS